MKQINKFITFFPDLKKGILILFLVLLRFSSISQTYHPLLTPNKYWDIFHGDPVPLCGSSGGDDYFVSNDTLIGGDTYKIILSHPIKSFQGAYCPPFYIDTSTIGPKAFMREDTLLRRVFINNNGVDELIYDFSLSINDTLFDCNQNIVDTITIETLANGDLRKKIKFKNGSWCIEGIGGSNGLFNCLIVPISTYEEYSCVRDNGINLFSNLTLPYPTQCLGTVSIKEENLVNDIDIDILNNDLLISSSKDELNLNFYDLNGRLCFESKVNNGITKLHLNYLKPTFYIVKIYNKNFVKSKLINILN